MKMPGFSAQSSLYRSASRYRSSNTEVRAYTAGHSVVAALSFEDTRRCSNCENGCNEDFAKCEGYAAAVWAAGLAYCAFTGPFAPACAGPATFAYGLAHAACAGKFAACEFVCNKPGDSSCCPVFCELGRCCSRGETCFSGGCCPNDQVVCGNNCCSAGEKCCGDTCCPAHFYCLDGHFCSEFPSHVPFGKPPRPTRPPNQCIVGVPCGPTCCPPGLQCCSYSDKFGADCRTSCLH
jgi:hypothetical protein